uniref:Tenascin-X (Trinotate prediction) n=1 Tax=Henneguya salminicola TaxID=69463 RepID=A0A6G3MFU6_HENSL
MCTCFPGYIGEYCQDWTCDYKCFGKGYCVGPNKCACLHPFTGNDCDGIFCNETDNNLCGEKGVCYKESDNIKCKCYNSKLSGDSCEVPICVSKCIHGICIFDLEKNDTRCICFQRYKGNNCGSIYIIKFIRSNGRKN